MGGGGGGESTTKTNPQAAQIAPEFKDFAKQVGQRAIGHLDEFNLSDFAGNLSRQIPGLTPLQAGAMGAVAHRFQNGIPVPQSERVIKNLMPYQMGVAQQQIDLQSPEIQAMIAAGQLPGMVGQQIGVDPLRYQQYYQSQAVQNHVANPIGMQGFEGAGIGTLGMLPGIAGQNANEQFGINALQQFAGGELSNSPAIQAAVAQIASTVGPAVENKMAKAGLGRSGALGQELQQAMVGTLLPLYMQGLQQQQSAGGQLAQIGSGQAQRGMQAFGTLGQAELGLGGALAGREGEAMNRTMTMENLLEQVAQQIGGRGEELGTEALNRLQTAIQQTLVPTLMEGGGRQASRMSDTINRILQTSGQQTDDLLTMGEREENRENQRIQDAFKAGEIDRNILDEISKSEHSDVLRRQALAEVFHTALLGQIPSFTVFPATQTQKTDSSK